MVPSLTASGYLVSWKWRRAWLFPPEPSKYLRPHSTFPSVRFIQIFSWRSHTSHRQPLQCRETKVLMKECYINWWGEKINYISFLKCIHFLQLHVGLFYAKKKEKELKSAVLHIVFQQSHTWQAQYQWRNTPFCTTLPHQNTTRIIANVFLWHENISVLFKYSIFVKGQHVSPWRDFDSIVQLFQISSMLRLQPHLSIPLLYLQGVRHRVSSQDAYHGLGHLQRETNKYKLEHYI